MLDGRREAAVVDGAPLMAGYYYHDVLVEFAVSEVPRFLRHGGGMRMVLLK
jgi:hypothetical protein